LVAFRPVAISLTHTAALRFTRNVRRIAIVSDHARLLMTAFCANKYLKIRIENRIARLTQFQKQFAATLLAVRGRWRRDKVTHKLTPFVRHESQRSGGMLKRIPTHILVEGLAL
jgi:hypothetical protein